MPGCLLSAKGAQFDVDAFMKDSTWVENAKIFHRGDATSPRSRSVQQHSGLSLGISDSDEDDLEPQLRDAMDFLQEERDEILRLVAFPGIESVEFRIGFFWWRDTLCQFHTISSEFMHLAGHLGVDVTLCVYGASENKPEAEPNDAPNDGPYASVENSDASGGGRHR